MALKYRLHPQVVLEEAAGRHFLVSFGKTDHCLPYLREINDTGAFYWKLAADGYDLDSMLAIASDTYQIPCENLKKGIIAFFNDLQEKGYIAIDK